MPRKIVWFVQSHMLFWNQRKFYLSCIFPIVLLWVWNSLKHIHTDTHIHYTTMCPNHTQKYICTHTPLPLIRSHTLQYSVSDSHKHTHCITVGGSYTPIHTYTLHYWHTHVYTCTFYYSVFDSNAHMHTYVNMYTMLFDSYTQLTHVCVILFCITCIYIHTHTHFALYLIYMHILTYWSIYIHTK